MPFVEPTNEDLRRVRWDLVVIGRGFSALVNCATRFATRDLPENTLILGLKDPWRSYIRHKMGQYPALLALPGYLKYAQHRNEDFHSFLCSRRFAIANRVQLHALLRHGVFQATGIVEDPLSFVQGKWMVPFNRKGEKVTIVSKRVDICTGPGPGRVFHPGGEQVYGPWREGIRDSFSVELLQELQDEIGDRALIADRFLQKRDVRGDLLVVGEGPLAASVVEHALNSGDGSVLWVGRPLEMAKLSFPASTRYDNLVANAGQVRASYSDLESDIDTGKPLDITGVTTAMQPKSSRLTIFLGAISGVETTAATLVGQSPFAGQELSFNNTVEHPKGSQIALQFETIVISASNQNSETERRSAAHILRSLPKVLARDAPLSPIAANDMFVGLRSPDGTLRVLGAAARNGLLLRKLGIGASAAETSYRDWYNTLPLQAKMADFAMGVTVSAATISMANDFYSVGNPDKCMQTALLPAGPLLAKRCESVCPLDSGAEGSNGFTEFPRPG